MIRQLVSIVMPVYNAELYLMASIVSILKQSYSNLEVIIVDDGCQDSSIEIVRSLKDERIRIIQNQTNLGLAESLNIGIQASSGAYIARMDADDIAHPQRIERQISLLESRTEIDIVGSAMQFFGYSKYRCSFPLSHDECCIQLLFNVCFGHPTVVFKRKVFDDPSNLYNPALRQYSEEYDLWCRLSDRFTFCNLPDALLDYRTYSPVVKRDAENLRKQNSIVIQRNFIEKVLGKITANELEVHGKLSLMEKVHNVKELQACDQWLSKILTVNRERQILNQEFLGPQLGKRFFEFCYFNSALGFGSISEYDRSEWAKYYHPSFGLRAKHLLKALLPSAFAR